MPGKTRARSTLNKAPAQLTVMTTGQPAVISGRAGSAPYPKDVGRALAQYRQKNELTLQDVSLAIGVSPGTLSKLENAKGLPSFRTLMRILQHIDLSAAGPTPPAATARKTVTRRGSIVLAYSDKGEFHIHAADLPHKAMFPMTSLISLQVPPPFETWSRHAGEEFVYVLRGAIKVYVEHHRPYLVREGESTYYDSGMCHVLVAHGGADALVLSVSTSDLTGGVGLEARPGEE